MGTSYSGSGSVNGKNFQGSNLATGSGTNHVLCSVLYVILFIFNHFYEYLKT